MNKIMVMIESFHVHDFLEKLSIPSKIDLFKSILGTKNGYSFYQFEEDDHLDFILQFQGFFQEASYILENAEYEWLFYQIYGDYETKELDLIKYGNVDDYDHVIDSYTDLEIELAATKRYYME